MRHAGDGVGFHHGLAARIPPHAVRIAVDLVLRHRRLGQPVQVEPLPDQRVGIGRIDRPVGIAVPHRQLRPWPFVRSGTAHQIAELMARARRSVTHFLQRLPHIERDAVRQARDHRAAGEDVRISREHRRRHRAARRQTGDEDPRTVDVMAARHVLDHLPDRADLAAVAADVVRREPVEAGVGIVGAGLLRQQQREAVTLRQRAPAGADLIAGGILGAAVQDHDQGQLLGDPLRDEREHPQVPGIGAKRGGLGEPAVVSRLAPSQAIETVHFSELAEEIDMVFQ